MSQFNLNFKCTSAFPFKKSSIPSPPLENDKLLAKSVNSLKPNLDLRSDILNHIRSSLHSCKILQIYKKKKSARFAESINGKKVQECLLNLLNKKFSSKCSQKGVNCT